jgi:hypothetical protein
VHQLILDIALLFLDVGLLTHQQFALLIAVLPLKVLGRSPKELDLGLKESVFMRN